MIEAIVVLTVLCVLAALLFPAVQQARETASRMSCANHLGQVSKALSLYHDTHAVMPIEYQSMWCTAVLPGVDQRNLYDAYVQTREPWSPENAVVVRATVPVFLCPAAGPTAISSTWGLGDMGLNAEFVGRRQSEIVDGMSQTAMVCDLRRSEARLNEWAMGPLFDTIQPATAPHAAGQNVGFADGSVRLLPRDIHQEVLDAIVTVSGREVLSAFGW